MNSQTPRRRSYDKMADKAQQWITTMWPILVCLVGIVYHSATFKANVTAQINHLATSHRFEMKAIEDNVKRNELRTARLESSIINSESKLSKIDKNLDKMVASLSNLKYIYITKEEGEKFITRKEVDGRLIKSK